MTNREAYEIWAPTGARWVDWVRPVPFIMYSSDNTCIAMDYSIPCINYLDDMEKQKEETAIILDLPGYTGINEALALGKLGWRPIPLYNGTDEQTRAMALVENHGIERALIWGANVLKDIKLKEPAITVILEEVVAGTGGIDMHSFVREIHNLPQKIPFMMEHLSSEAAYDQAAAYIRKCAKEENIVI